MLKMNEDYYKKQIEGLLLILDGGANVDFMITRSYVKEKLNMILKGGANFHPIIKRKVGL